MSWTGLAMVHIAIVLIANMLSIAVAVKKLKKVKCYCSIKMLVVMQV